MGIFKNQKTYSNTWKPFFSSSPPFPLPPEVSAKDQLTAKTRPQSAPWPPTPVSPLVYAPPKNSARNPPRLPLVTPRSHAEPPSSPLQSSPSACNSEEFE